MSHMSAGAVDVHPFDMHVPFSILNDSPVFRPGEPSGPWLPLLFLVEHANDARHIAAVGDFWNAPYSEITVRCLCSQHLRLLL
jgi:hypothetical protein